MANPHAFAPARKTAHRLRPLDRPHELAPWRRATELTRYFLYWMPVDGFPPPASQRQWLLCFFDRFIPLVEQKSGLRIELFLQFNTAAEVRETFQKCAMEFWPMLGFSRRPGATLPAMPTHEELHENPEACLRGEKKIDIKKYMAGYCYWFAAKLERRQRQAFLGEGGMTMMFLSPDPNTMPPDSLQAMGAKAEIAAAFALQDDFLPKSKRLFGAGLEDDPQYPGLQFIIPLLAAGDFLDQPEEEAGKWFELFDIYVNESPADRGILLASRFDWEDDLIALLQQMKDEGLEYPRR